MIPKRTKHYTELVLQGLRRGWAVAKICAMGKAGLLNIGDEPDPEFPVKTTVFDWLGVDPQFAELYLAARRSGCEAMVDDGIVIVDNSYNDTEWCVDEETGELHKIVDHEHVQRSRLRADYRKWYVAKLVPRLYGERVEVEHKVNSELTARLTSGRQRALGDANDGVLQLDTTRLIEGSAVRVEDDGSDLV